MKRKRKNKDTVRVLLMTVIITIIGIAIIDLLIVAFPLYCQALIGSGKIYINYTQVSENVLLSNGIAIIAIAISVWAGLNIIQVLEKDKLVEIGEQVIQFEAERKQLYKAMLLDELRTYKRSISLFFYERFIQDENIDNLPSGIFYNLFEIENTYNKIYGKRVIINFQNDKKSMEKLLDNIRGIIREMDSLYKDGTILQDTHDLINEYVKTRQAEFYFNRGYANELETDLVICSFENTVKEYSELYSLSFTNLAKDDLMGFEEHLKKYLDQQKDIDGYIVHVLNTIAESYSMIAQARLTLHDRICTPECIKNCEISDCNEKSLWENVVKKELEERLEVAKMVFKYIIDQYRKEELDEFIYRNLGATLERLGRIEGNFEKYYKNAKENYDEAIQIAIKNGNKNAIREQVFYVWGSLYAKNIKNKNLLSIVLRCETNLSEEDRKEFREWTEEAVAYMNLATRVYPGNRSLLKMYGIASGFRVIIHSHEKDSYLVFMEVERFKDIWREINLLKNDRDNYFETLSTLYNAIIKLNLHTDGDVYYTTINQVNSQPQ